MPTYEMYEITNPGAINSKPDHIIKSKSIRGAKQIAKRLKMFQSTAIEIYQNDKLVSLWWDGRWTDVSDEEDIE